MCHLCMFSPSSQLSSLSFCIGKYYIATMTMITASTSLTIFIMNIHFCGAEAKPVPHWAKVLIIDYMSKIFFVYEVGENCTTPESERTPLYPDEPLMDNSPYLDDTHKYSNGHGIHHHNKNLANGNANHNNHASRMDRSQGTSTRQYHHIRRDELDYQAPAPHPTNLQHLNGGLKEPLLYPSEKLQVPACPCRCPSVQHNQVLSFLCFTYMPFSSANSQLHLTWLNLFLRW